MFAARGPRGFVRLPAPVPLRSGGPAPLIADWRNVRNLCTAAPNVEAEKKVKSSDQPVGSTASAPVPPAASAAPSTPPSSNIAVAVKKGLEKKINPSAEDEEEIWRPPDRRIRPLSFREDPAGYMSQIPSKIKHGLVHTWLGLKYFGLNTATASGLMWKALKGKSLTRREHRLLVTTASDIFRMVPFSLFIIIPMAEFLLPVFLKIFPNMLPSTFTSQNELEVKLYKKLKARLEMAKFLQQSAEHMKTRSSKFDKNFPEFMQDIKSGQPVSKDQVYKFVSAFKDDLTLANLRRSQIQAMCRFIDIIPYGPTDYLRRRLANRIEALKVDDRLLKAEGLQSLSLIELKQAVAARGMSSYGPRKQLELLLEEWLDLSLNQKVPTAMLILSRAFRLLPHQHPDELLKNTISRVPEKVLEEASTVVASTNAEDDGTGRVNLQAKLDLLKEERKKVKEESRAEEERAKAEAEKKAKAEAEKAKAAKAESAKLEGEGILEGPAIPVEVGAADQSANSLEEEVLEGESTALEATTENQEDDVHKIVTASDILMELADPIAEEKDALEDLEAKILHGDLLEHAKDLPQDEATSKLEARLASLVKRLDSEIKRADFIPSFDLDRDGLVTKEEMRVGLAKLSRFGPEEIEQIIEKMDFDADGLIHLNHIKSVARMESDLLSLRQLGVKADEVKRRETLKNAIEVALHEMEGTHTAPRDDAEEAKAAEAEKPADTPAEKAKAAEAEKPAETTAEAPEVKAASEAAAEEAGSAEATSAQPEATLEAGEAVSTPASEAPTSRSSSSSSSSSAASASS